MPAQYPENGQFRSAVHLCAPHVISNKLRHSFEEPLINRRKDSRRDLAPKTAAIVRRETKSPHPDRVSSLDFKITAENALIILELRGTRGQLRWWIRPFLEDSCWDAAKKWQVWTSLGFFGPFERDVKCFPRDEYSSSAIIGSKFKRIRLIGLRPNGCKANDIPISFSCTLCSWAHEQILAFSAKQRGAKSQPGRAPVDSVMSLLKSGICNALVNVFVP